MTIQMPEIITLKMYFPYRYGNCPLLNKMKTPPNKTPKTLN